MSATEPTAHPTADPTAQPPAQPTVPPASPHAETDSAGGTGRGGRGEGRYAGPRRLTRSREDRMLTGVCGGLARYLDLDPTLVRVLVVLATLLGVGTVAVAYVVAAVVMPLDEPATAAAVTTVTGPR